jgi:hypothetical protein
VNSTPMYAPATRPQTSVIYGFHGLFLRKSSKTPPVFVII